MEIFDDEYVEWSSCYIIDKLIILFDDIKINK